MVCTICRDMLARQSGRLCKGTFDLQFEHHTTSRRFQQSIHDKCIICRALYVHVQASTEAEISDPERQDVESSGSLNESALDPLNDISLSSFSSRASLSVLKAGHLYSLEITMSYMQKQIRHEFHLQDIKTYSACPNQRSSHVICRGHTGFKERQLDSSNIPTQNKYGAAVRWLRNCDCASSQKLPFYPKRLISLKELKYQDVSHDNGISSGKPADKYVHLVESASWSHPGSTSSNCMEGDQKYVTLSHCWGQTVGEGHKLTSENYKEFQRGVPVHNLPKTFRDSILFAATLEGVGYIWIDSLCIIQGDEKDWLDQSAVMHRIYSETYLNISATTSTNSEGGLFKHSEWEMMDEEEVLVHIEGLPLAYSGQFPPPRTDTADLKREIEPVVARDHLFLQRCTIVDATFWADQVDRGAVNTRGWVLQERFMSPRVLHFCHDQIGWECCGGQSQYKRINEKDLQRKSLSSELGNRRIVEGIKMRANKLEHSADIDKEEIPAAFSLWAAIVNAYTKTVLSHSKDKLVALSGLAKVMAGEMECAYVAGLWRKYLANQLLWYVEPIFNHSDRSFSYPATFEETYRAPSFSWAAINVTGHGITYANVAKYKSFVHIEDTSVETLAENEFGVVTRASIVLWGRIRRARLISRPRNRFAWHLVGCGDLDSELHQNVYLDCPLRDMGCIDDPKMDVYVLPVASESTHRGTSKSTYLVCLLLRLGQGKGAFKRIGITKLSPSMDRMAMDCAKGESNLRALEHRILQVLPADVHLPHDGYDKDSGRHRVHLI